MFHSHPLEMLSRPSLLLTRRRLAAGDAKPKSVSTAGDVKNHWWSKFSTHHYLGGGKFNTACDAFVFVGGVVTKTSQFRQGGTLVAFDSHLARPGGSVFCMRGQHRLVVAPDFQGLGIGSEMCAHDASECITEARIKGGVTHRFFSKTFHKKLGVSRDGSLL